MKKMFLTLVFALSIIIPSLANVSKNNILKEIRSLVYSNDDFVNQVTLKTARGDKEKSLNVYCRQLQNRKYYYYIQFNQKEYEVEYSSNNNCFTVYLDGDRWYFSDRTLELMFFSTKRSYNL